MFCRSCGKELAPEARFCDKCGAEVMAQATPAYGASSPPPSYNAPPPYSAPPQYGAPPPYGYPGQYPMIKEKEPVLALVLSLIVPGLGQMYCDRIARGVVILLTIIAIQVISFIFMWGMMGSSTMWWESFGVVSILSSIVTFVIWIWQLVDAYQQANRFNEAARMGRRPW